MSSKPLKWSRQEDQNLLKGVQKYGTSWTQIITEFCQGRTKNAVIKRWHGKLKDLDGDLNKIHHVEEDQIQQKNNEKIPSLGSKSDNEENDDSESKQVVDDYQYIRSWSVKDDKTLKDLVIKKQIYDWQALSRYFNTSPKQVIKRWQKQIYPQIKIKTKVAGALRWSKEQDAILVGCQKGLGCDWESINIFIPSRSVFSIEGRWRRISKNEVQMNLLNLTSIQDIQNKRKMMNKYQYRKYIIRLIGQKIEQSNTQIDNKNN